MLQLFLSHADASVLDRKAQNRVLRRERHGRHFQLDVALMSELESIGQKVDQNLHEPDFVTNELINDLDTEPNLTK